MSKMPKMFAILTLFWLIASIAATAQKSNVYEASFVIGAVHNLASRGPTYKTDVSEVKFVKPITKTFGGVFDLKPSGRVFYGLELIYDEFDYGYIATPRPYSTSLGLGITSGDMASDDRVVLYKTGIRIGYRLFDNRKIHVNSILIPTVAYYRYLELLNDTTDNVFWRSNSKKQTHYNNHPPYQNQGVYFLFKGTIELQYDWSKRFATSLLFSYQQGFVPFVIDSINIVRPFEPTGPKEHMYWTKVDGTSLQWHVAFKYIF